MIELFVQSRYRVNRKTLRDHTRSFLKKAGLNPDEYTVSIALIGDRKMAQMHKTYANKQGTTPVLAFPHVQSGYEKQYHASRTIDGNEPEETTLIGEVLISYPQTLIFAADENKLVDQKLCEFIEHGITNLLTSK